MAHVDGVAAAANLSKKDTHSVSKRLKQELMSFMRNGSRGISAFPDGDNLFKWIGTIEGPEATVYEGLTYKISLEFPGDYPYSAPSIRFTTECFHPNVDKRGNICLDILREKWSSAYDVKSLLLSLQSLLGEPNINSPLNPQAADLWKDQIAYKKQLFELYQKDSLKE